MPQYFSAKDAQTGRNHGENVRTVFPQRFTSMFDGWSIGSKYYVAVFEICFDFGSYK